MSRFDDDFRLRPGRIRNDGARAPSFVAQVKRATERAGGLVRGSSSARPRAGAGFGRGRVAALARGLQSTARRVVVKARVVRHAGAAFRAAPLGRHIAYLEREGVAKGGQNAQMFGADDDAVGGEDFAARAKDDRHHFRFIVSPQDADQMADLRAFTRELMEQAQEDLGTRLDWLAVDHWNTDNPHVHILVRGRDEDGGDLVISRAYISHGLRARAEALATLELGPRSARDVAEALGRDVLAERWTGLDATLRAMADETGGALDLRPGDRGSDHPLRSLLVGRAMTLERLGLAEAEGPGRWRLASEAEDALRAMADRGDIIRTLHKLSGRGAEPFDPTRLAIHDPDAPDPVIGRLVARGLHDELRGSAYVVIDGVDGRRHHLRFTDLERTGDALPGAIVEARNWTDDRGRQRAVLATRSDLPLEKQITAPGATWLDRQLVGRSTLAATGFGAEVRQALDRRTDHLVEAGLGRRQGRAVIFTADLLGTLRRRELSATAAQLAGQTGLEAQDASPGELVSGVYRRRLDLASGRFAMIDNGLGFQLVPWRPALEPHLGQAVSGVISPSGGVEWRLGRARGLGL